MDYTTEQDAGWRELLDAMVGKLKDDGVLTDPRVEDAMRAVPRHEFLREDCDAQEAYTGELVRTLASPDGGTLSTASHVSIVAKMLEVLHAQPGEDVLEIGLGTGYNAALLGRLVEPGRVTAIDNEPPLVRLAERNLERLGITNVTPIARDGWFGDAETAPFDATVATVAVPDISPHWVAQLHEGGRLVVPLWISTIVQPGVQFLRRGERLEGEVFGNPGFIMLKGRGLDDRGSWVLIDDSLWTLPDATVEAWETLRGLLSRPHATATKLPELDRMWAYWLGLEDPNVCSTYSIDATRTERTGLLGVGLFDQDAGGVAVVDGKTRVVSAYGATATLDRLLELVLHRRPSSAETLEDRRIVDLRIDAVPHASEERPEAGWLIERRHYDFLVRVRSDREDGCGE